MELVALAPFFREKAKKEVLIFTCSNRAVALFEQVKPSGNGIAMAARLFLLLFFSFGFSGFFRRMPLCILVHKKSIQSCLERQEASFSDVL